MKDFNNDFDYFTNLINSNTNFAYTRYADGEVALMKGQQIDTNSQASSVDNWTSPPILTKVGKQLLETLSHTENNYYYAISSDTDFKEDSLFLKSKIKTNNITFANLWINANYQKMKAFYNSLQKEVYLICNEKAKKESFPFGVIEIFPFPNNCISYWEQYEDDYISQLLNYIKYVSNKTFLISAGPVSEILIHKMYECNPNNQYIDVGSSIDEFVHNRITRPYMDSNSLYSKEISYFYE
jgi:hypothetical protein